MRRIEKGRLAVVAVAVSLALVASGCAFIVANTANPGGPGDALFITAPANHTQLTSNASVLVSIDVAGIRPGTLHVDLATGTRIGEPKDITAKFVVNGNVASATLGAADIDPGLSYLVARGVPLGGADPVSRETTWSYEPGVDVSLANRCEFLGQSRCMLPFPNDYFTEADASSATGRRVHFDAQSLPVNNNGVHVDPSEWNRNDGFSPGAMIVLQVPEVDLGVTGAAPITDLVRSLDAGQPIVLMDADTHARVPFFAELDVTAADDAHRVLIIRPARNLGEGHRFVVALRNLKRSDGSVIVAPRAFQLYRDGIPTFLPAVEARRGHMNDLLGSLRAGGVGSTDLYLAWDFTVASQPNLSGRLLHIRDDAFASLDGGVPAFSVTTVQDNVNTNIWRRVTGTFQVPLYLTGTGGPGERFHYAASPGPDALPTRNGTFTAAFLCNIPRSVSQNGANPVSPGRALVYGHGLLGGKEEVNSFGSQANTMKSVMCATNWIGMSSEDIPNVAGVIGDFSKFPSMPDRLQQGILNTQFLARLMKDPRGFATDAAFQAGSPATPAFVTGDVFFNGNSQGGIIGGAATAVSTEWTRAVLGVPGMNFSTLLNRSVDFDPFKALLDVSYPDPIDQQLGLSTIQMLWDRGEADGYALHLSFDPLPDTPDHKVMLLEAFADHQVTNIATETEARTIPYMYVWQPALAAGRSPDVTPMWGIPALPDWPYPGSILVMWDYGTPAAPTTNTPNRAGTDPHGLGAGNPKVAQQVDGYLKTGGWFFDVCGGPCVG